MSQGSGEKTEKASPKKKRDAREKGQVNKSNDLASAAMLFLLFGVAKVGYDSFFESMRSFTRTALSPSIAQKAANLTAKTAMSTYRDVLFTAFPAILPLLLTAMVCAVLVHMLQTGPLLVTSKLKPDFGKLNPLQGFGRIFSVNTLVELFKSVVKIIILGVVGYRYLKQGIASFSALIYVDVGQAFGRIMSECLTMGMMLAMALLGFAAADVFYQWWKFQKDLMMTKQEVKEENKQTEGDPQVKGKIRQKQRQMSTMRMMRSVPDADVVITNPTHFAVALRYKESEDAAPVVLAKGQDHLALRIRELAKKHKVTVVENKPVARALYASCQVGDVIPPELYQAVADILIYVYKTTKTK